MAGIGSVILKKWREPTFRSESETKTGNSAKKRDRNSEFRRNSRNSDRISQPRERCMEHVGTEEDDEVSSSNLVYVDSPYTRLPLATIHRLLAVFNSLK